MVKDVIGYDGFYQVDTNGSVWTCRCLGRTKDKKGGWRKMTPTKCVNSDHLLLGLSRNGKTKSYYVHALVLLTFVGPCPKGMECRHKDGNPQNNHLRNLEWNTYEVNQRDRAKHGTSNRGEKCATSKLKPANVKWIRKAYRTGNRSMQSLAYKFNVSLTTISEIIRRQTWRHI